jgi:hypothetical protein
MSPSDIGKFVEELFQWEPHRVGALVTRLVLGFTACWALRRRSDAPLRKTIRSLEAEREKQTSENKRLHSELTALRDEQLNKLDARLDERHVPRGQRVVMAWKSAGRRVPVCILIRGEKNHRVMFPDGKDDKVSVEELSPWS